MGDKGSDINCLKPCHFFLFSVKKKLSVSKPKMKRFVSELGLRRL